MLYRSIEKKKISHVSAVMRLKFRLLCVSQKRPKRKKNSYRRWWRKLVWPWKRKPFATEHNYSFSATYSFCFQFHLIIHSLLSLSFKSIFWLTTLISISIAIFLLLFHIFFFSVDFTRTACSHVASIKPSHIWTQHIHTHTIQTLIHHSTHNWSCRKRSLLLIQIWKRINELAPHDTTNIFTSVTQSFQLHSYRNRMQLTHSW